MFPIYTLVDANAFVITPVLLDLWLSSFMPKPVLRKSENNFDPIALLIHVGIKTANFYVASRLAVLKLESNLICLHSNLEDFNNTKSSIEVWNKFLDAIAIIKQSGHKLLFIFLSSLAYVSRANVVLQHVENVVVARVYLLQHVPVDLWDFCLFDVLEGNRLGFL